jgi:N-acetyl-gamma-glutamyl-phosphate reductase
MAIINASVIGASGYSGIELASILLRHPGVRVARLFARSSAGKRVDEVYPHLRSRTEGVFESYAPEKLKDSDVAFIALPSGEALSLVPELLATGIRVIDLGGDFRLKDTGAYQTYYGRTHTAPEALSRAVYSIPELHSASVPGASLIANPGCYPTSAILPLAPLLQNGIIATEGIVINALSGVSGAGRSTSLGLSLAEANESVKPYKVGVHQHTPEIEAALSAFASTTVTVTFTPHLLPINRGILTTTVAPLLRSVTPDEIGSVYARAYGSAPFVRLLGSHPPEIKHVTNSNFIDIGWHLYPQNGHIIVISAIDNLVKGAAGQAVQNFNLLFGLPETDGLL